MIWVAALVLLVDFVSKSLSPGHQLSEDFALGTPAPGLGVMIALMVLGAIAAAVWVKPWWAAGLMVGGALGNIVDRVLYGGVRDWIPGFIILFNVADAALFVGAVCSWRHQQRGGHGEEAPEVHRSGRAARDVHSRSGSRRLALMSRRRWGAAGVSHRRRGDSI